MKSLKDLNQKKQYDYQQCVLIYVPVRCTSVFHRLNYFYKGYRDSVPFVCP